MTKRNVPVYNGTLRNHSIRLPHCIRECSGIRIFGMRIKSIAFTTDVAIIKNINADAIIAVYPFTPQPAISQAVIGISDVPVFVGVRIWIRAADAFVNAVMPVGEHRDGGIAVNQFTHIHIRRVVAPAIGKEIAAHLRQRADGDFLLLLFGIADACQQNQRK